MIRTETKIRTTFDDIIIKIANVMDVMYLLDTKLVFDNDSFGNIAIVNKNIIIFSILDYNLNKYNGNIVEYKNVVEHLEIEYYLDHNDNYTITTNVPEIYVIGHEIAHIITHNNNPYAPDHGESFCNIYRDIIGFLKPQVYD